MEVKGSVVALFRGFIHEHFGTDGYQRWLKALSPTSGMTFEAPIMPVNWYPLQEALVQPTEAICRLFFQGDLIGARECGKYSANEGLLGTYKFFIRWGSPAYALQKTADIFPTYYRPSSAEVTRLEKKSGIIRITQFPESHEIIEARIAGWIERALQMSACRGVHVGIIASIARGESHTDYHCSWE